MGTPIIPSEPGLRCPTCFYPGGSLAGGITPKRVWVNFKNILPGETYDYLSSKPLNGKFMLQQVMACGWQFDNADISIFFWLADNRSHLILQLLPMIAWQYHFYNLTYQTCMTVFENQQTDWHAYQGFGGSGIITFEDSQ